MVRFLLSFVFHYPFFMAFTWIFGSLIYHLRRSPFKVGESPPKLKEYPKASILIACHNEEHIVRETVQMMMQLDYPDYEVITIDDGSTDGTAEVLAELSSEFPELRIVTLQTNQGKPTALNAGALVSEGEFLVAVDADSFLDRHALTWLMWHFVNFPRVGAVTGNARIRNRTTLLAKIQVGEYSTIIGMIKRTQRILGKLFTVSGVVAAYRKRAVLDAGFWTEDAITEDIDTSWKLQTRFWDLRFEEKALSWVLTTETVRGLWRQRVRWSEGGAGVMLRNIKNVLDWKQRRIWPVYLEYFVSVFWAYSFFR